MFRCFSDDVHWVFLETGVQHIEIAPAAEDAAAAVVYEKTTFEVIQEIKDNITKNYEAQIEDHVGDATVTIVDKLPYGIIEDESDIKQILYGNTKIVENIKINNKYMALTDDKNNLLAIIEKNCTDKNNKYAFIDID